MAAVDSALSAHDQIKAHLKKFNETDTDRYTIHCQVVECMNIYAADISGYSDPYIKIKITDAKEAKLKTFTASQTLNPIYNVGMSFTMPSSKDTLAKLSSSPTPYYRHVKESGTVLVEALDFDKANRNDPLGFCGLKLETLRKTGFFSGWFYFFKDKSIISDDISAHKNGVRPKIRPGRVYLRFIVDLDHSKWAKLEDGAFEQYRRSLFDLVRRLESECIVSNMSPFHNIKIDVPASLSFSYFIPHKVDLGTNTNLTEREKSQVSNNIDIRLLCATWNTGNSDDILPYEIRLWLRPGNDIYVISTQENSYELKKSKFKNSTEDWQNRITEALGDDFMFLQSQSLGQIHIHVFIRRALRPFVDTIQTLKASEATGVANIGTNKGGTCIALQILGRSYCFISAHLAAHTEQLERRNRDAADIIAGLKFKGNYDLDAITWFNHTFFMGDLNYRLNYAGDKNKPESDKHAEMLELIKQGKFGELLETDQLIQEMQKGTAFVGFNECTPNFAPTFKLEPGVPNTYNPKRAPSYCDRILWKSHEEYRDDVQLISVKSVPTILKSDHTPVMALFKASAPVLPPSTDPTRGDVQIRFVSAACTSLEPHDANGLADPYIRFFSPYLVDPTNCVFPKKSKTLSPSWEGVELKEFTLMINNPERLMNESIKIQLYDRDFGSTSLMASGVIPLKSLDLTDTNETTTIIVPLSNQAGLAAGVATFKIQLYWKKLNASTALTPYSAYLSGQKQVGLPSK